MKNKPVISAFYFPNWHVDPRNEELHGKGWTEWRVVQYAAPRFPGHDQPRIPLWGYEDEADPAVMRKKIETAAEYGINAFTFDYYWFSDGSYRERCLLEGFLPACRGTDFKFAVMWANHDPIYAHPRSYRKPADPLWSGAVSPKTFADCTDHLIETYFKHPNYLRIDGKAYFSIFNLSYILKENGQETVTEMFSDLRRRAACAGAGEIWLDADINLLGKGRDLPELNDLIRKLGLNSCSTYNYFNLPPGFPAFDYEAAISLNMEKTQLFSKNIPVPFNPAAPSGYDCSPRTVQSDMFEPRGYPFCGVAVNDTPENWEKYLLLLRDFLDSETSTARILNLACWNEWTEGMYLEPDARYGYGKLEVVKNVFGTEKTGDRKKR